MSQNCDFFHTLLLSQSELSLFYQFLEMKFKKYTNSFVAHLRDSLTFYSHCFHSHLPPLVGNQVCILKQTLLLHSTKGETVRKDFKRLHREEIEKDYEYRGEKKEPWLF